jgi:predicted ATP-grasp superfamily ATP-dependent carboligase
MKSRATVARHSGGPPEIGQSKAFEDLPNIAVSRAESDWPPAVIAGAFQTGVLGVRSLKRRSVRAVCFDSNPTNPGFQSVYGPAFLSPDPDTHSEQWLDFMLGLPKHVGHRAALIASSDKFVSAIAKHAVALQDHFILSPGIALQGLLTNKHTQYELAARHGMPMPRTRFVKSLSEAQAFAAEAAFPCVVKPIHFREWQRFPAGHPLLDSKVAVVANEAELLDAYHLASRVNSNVILQEIILGDDRAKRVYLSCYDGGSRRIANAMFRELRCDPVGFGPATVTEPVVDDEVDEVCDRFLKSINYVGICEIEMKRDTRDGQPKLIEANPRLSGGGDAAPYAGVDLCWIHYLDLIGQRVTPISPKGNDFRHVVLRADANALPRYWSAGIVSWRDVIHSYRPPLAFFDFDWRDWRYSLETLFVCARLLFRALMRGVSKPKRSR